MKLRFALSLFLLLTISMSGFAQDSDEPEDPSPGLNSGLVSALAFVFSDLAPACSDLEHPIERLKIPIEVIASKKEMLFITNLFKTILSGKTSVSVITEARTNDPPTKKNTRKSRFAYNAKLIRDTRAI